jgi:hypothetical protein
MNRVGERTLSAVIFIASIMLWIVAIWLMVRE